MSILLSFIILPPSLFVKVMSIISLISMSNTGLSETKDKHVRYSKLSEANLTSNNRQETKVASRIGMLIVYTPALVASIASFAILGGSGSRCLLLSSVLSLHFFKRVFEVLFIHRYSGAMMADSAVLITIRYCANVITMIYAQHLANGVAEPVLNLKYPGVILFLLGVAGNFYHHFLLSRLRDKDDKGYKIPKGGSVSICIMPSLFV